MAIENLIKMAEQVSRLGDQDLAMLTKEEGIQSVLAATEMKDRERVRSEVPVMNMNQPTVIDNLINRTLGMNRQVDPTAMPMPSPDMMGNMPMEAPNMPPMQQTMPNNIDPRMLAQQPPMARMGGLLRRFANGGDLDTDYIKALGEDPNKISMARYNEITSPEFQANQLGYNYNFMGGIDFKGMLGGPSNKLEQAKFNKNRYLQNVLNQNLPANEFQAGLDQIDKEISNLELDVSERSKDIEAESELRKLIDQGLIQSNPQYLSFADQAQGDTSKLLQLIEQAETDKKIDEDTKVDDKTKASVSNNAISDIVPNQVNQNNNAQDLDGKDANIQGVVVANQNNTSGSTIDRFLFGQPTNNTDNQFNQSVGIIKSLAEKDPAELISKSKTTTQGVVTDVDEITNKINQTDSERLLELQNDAKKAEEALNKISDNDFPSRQEIIDRNKQQVKLGIASAFFNAAATGKPSFMESMGQAFGDASAVMSKGTAKEQKDLMQLAIADYNRASKKYELAESKRSKLSETIIARQERARQFQERKEDQSLEIQKIINAREDKIAELALNATEAQEERRKSDNDLSIKANKLFSEVRKHMTTDVFTGTVMSGDELDAATAMEIGPVALRYSSQAVTATMRSIDKFENEIPELVKEYRKDPDNEGLSTDAIYQLAEQKYRENLIAGKEQGSALVFDRFYPIIDNMAKLKISNPDSHQANVNRLKQEYPWLPTAYYE